MVYYNRGMVQAERASRRRGRPPGSDALTRDQIAQSAADLADRDGWESLSFTALARSLDRHATSMYSHFSSLEDLRRAVSLVSADDLASRVWSAAIGKTGGAALYAIAVAYRSFAAEHPGRTRSLSAINRDDPEFAGRMSHLHEPLAATFRSLGLDQARSVLAHEVFGATINGLVNTGGEDLVDQAVQLFLAAVSTGSWPNR